ncbi:MAG: cation/H(+) antiporter [Gammaproteobacteria bacterium]|nr:cation/H(+) antiporter [Gammaproteobacteria bacterium]
MENLEYLALIWAGVYLSSYLAHKTRLTPVLYFLGFGSVMVNVGLLPVESTQFLTVFSELGIILIMFSLGFEESGAQFVSTIKRSWGIAFFGALFPFITAYSLTYLFWQDFNIALMCGLTMTATAVSLTLVSLKSEGLQSSPPATAIMTSAVLDDIASLALVAIMVPIATGDASLTVEGILFTVGKAISFFVVIVVCGIWLFPERAGFFDRIPILGRINVKSFLGINQGETATLGVLLTALVIGLLAHYFGFHPAIGAYMAGLILKEEHFFFHDHPVTDYYETTRKIVENVAFTWIGPVFFVTLGARLVFDMEIFLDVLLETIVLFIAIFVVQISSAMVSARLIGRFSWPESGLIGIGMLGRAELAFVVINIAFVQNQILSDQAFYTLMFTIFWLNVSVPVSIKLFKPIYLEQTRQG